MCQRDGWHNMHRLAQRTSTTHSKPLYKVTVSISLMLWASISKGQKCLFAENLCLLNVVCSFQSLLPNLPIDNNWLIEDTNFNLLCIIWATNIPKTGWKTVNMETASFISFYFPMFSHLPQPHATECTALTNSFLRSLSLWLCL